MPLSRAASSVLTFWLVSFLVAGGLFTFANSASKSATNADINLCVNNKNKSVSYTKGAKSCPAGFSVLQVSGSELGDEVDDVASRLASLEKKTGGNSSAGDYTQYILDSQLPRVTSAIYTVQCGSELATATAIDVSVDGELSRTGYRSVLISSGKALRKCENQNVELRQNDIGWNGYVAQVDVKNNLSLIALKISNITKLKPAIEEPRMGEMLFTFSRAYDAIGYVDVGILRSINSDFDEEFHSIQVESSAPIFNKRGEFISIASRKPGVLCREILDCSASSSYRAWSD